MIRNAKLFPYAFLPRAGLTLALCAALAACAVGPDYQRPALDVGAAYKEGQVEVPGWKRAEPRDDVDRGQWWRVYDDATLNGLVDNLNASNQTIAQAEANYRQALGLVRGARAGFFPTVGAGAGLTRSGSGGNGSSSSSAGGGNVSNQYSLTGNVSWELDVWGRVRRSVESSEASAAASLADLAATRLSAQAALVQAYLQLRVLDEQKRLLDATVAAYEKSLQLTQNRYNVGVAGQSDVAVARTQVESTRAQSIDLDWQRGQYEHAIAVLMGQAPSRFSLPPAPFSLQLPQIPVGLPSELLERRPDVAAAERRAAAANAQIGVAQAAWFPSLTLSADGGLSQRPVRRAADRAGALLVAGAGAGVDDFRWRRAPGAGRAGARILRCAGGRVPAGGADRIARGRGLSDPAAGDGKRTDGAAPRIGIGARIAAADAEPVQGRAGRLPERGGGRRHRAQQ